MLVTSPQNKPIKLPRVLLLWWSMWLLASWLLAYSTNWSIAPSNMTYIASAQLMLVLLAIGLTIIWPLYRLSFRHPAMNYWTLLIDWLAVSGTIQIVLWPIRLSTQWPAIRVTLLDLTICTWALLIGGIITITIFNRLRSAWLWGMISCISVSLLAPVVSVILESNIIIKADNSELVYWSPITALWIMAAQINPVVSNIEWIRLTILATVAILLWFAIIIWPNKSRIHKNHRNNNSISVNKINSHNIKQN